MSGFFTPIADTEEVRQGDIIRKINPQSGESVYLGIVVTADCDIAQKKAGERYTWLEILPMRAYVNGPWAEEQLRKLAEKRAKTICETLNGQIKKLGLNLATLTSESLSEWLGASSPEQILTDIYGRPPSSESKPLKDLTGYALTVATGDMQPALTRLMAAWTLFGTEEKSQQESIRNAFKESGGFQDYFVLPELPKTPGIGFVVTLRSMSTLLAADLFLTEQDARIHDRPDAFHRLGRLSDGVRFAITQKLAFLFSRIGMPKSFESACETATEMMVEELFMKKTEKV